MAWIALVAVLAASAVLITLGAIVAPKQKAVAVGCALIVMFVLPWFAGATPLVRGLLAMNFIAVFRMIDVARTRESWSALRRIVHAFSFIDTRLVQREKPRIDVRGFAIAIAWAGLATGSFYVVRTFAPRFEIESLAIRWGAGLVFTYATIEAGYTLIRAGHRAVGFETPPLHVWPIAALSVTEFWGMRWARPVSQWLRANCFLPLARRRHPALGLLLGFVVSGVGHAYPALVGCSWIMMAWMLGYFVLQGLFAAAEARIGAAQWPRAGRRIWTVVIMVASSPLFVEPCLRVIFAS